LTAHQVGHQICDEVTDFDSRSGTAAAELQASCSDPCASVTKQYDLVLAAGSDSLQPGK